jgi:hypothetical protein
VSLCLIEHCAIKTWGNGGIAPFILNLGTSWRWVVSFTPRPLYALGIHWLGGGPPLSVWTLWRREKILPRPGIEPRPCVAVPSELSRHVHIHVLKRFILRASSSASSRVIGMFILFTCTFAWEPPCVYFNALMCPVVTCSKITDQVTHSFERRPRWEDVSRLDGEEIPRHVCNRKVQGPSAASYSQLH